MNAIDDATLLMNRQIGPFATATGSLSAPESEQSLASTRQFSQVCQPSTSSLQRSHKRVKSTRQEGGSRVKRETSVPVLSRQLSGFSLQRDPLPNMLSHETMPGQTSFSHSPQSSSVSLTTLHASSRRVSPEAVLHKSKSAGPNITGQNGNDHPFNDVSSTRNKEGEMTDYWERRPSPGQSSLGWLSPLRSEGIYLDDRLRGSLRHIHSRRDTDCSASSMEFSGSGTSSVSLLSLGRSSSEQQNRPDIITQWDENTLGADDEPARLSLDVCGQQDKIDAAKMSRSPSISPFLNGVGPKYPIGISTNVLGQTPTETLPMEPSPFMLDSEHELDPQPSFRSAAFFPRLLSKKKSSATLESENGRSAKLADPLEDEMMSDVKDTSHESPFRSKSFWDRTKIKSSKYSCKTSGLGLGIELSLHQSQAESAELAVSVASDSSGEIDLSPSRLPSIRHPSDSFAKSSKRQHLPQPWAISSNKLTRPSLCRCKFVTDSSLPCVSQVSLPTVPTINPLSAKDRLPMKRGITEPNEKPKPRLLSVDTTMRTPQAVPFADVKPSPVVFVSTGLVKKKSRFSGVEIPKFGSEPVVNAKRKKSLANYDSKSENSTQRSPSPISPIKSIRTNIPQASTSATCNTAQSIQQAQRIRGLRKKQSSMFRTSSSISSMDVLKGNGSRSINGVSMSPVTPTKADRRPMTDRITTPSPIRPPVIYPFASSNPVDLDFFSTPLSGRHNRFNTLDAPIAERYRSILAGSPSALPRNSRGPVARASNPMLATNIKSAAPIKTPARGSAYEFSMFEKKGRFRGDDISRLETDFILIKNLGAGAFSQVWKVQEKETGKIYAVKAGRPYTGIKNRLRQLEEIAILRELSLDSHPNVIQFVDSWESHSRLYILTSLADCGDLSSFLSLLSDHGGIREARVWKTLVELSEGIMHIHKHHFLHLDIKPSNILIDREGGLVVADLGMAVVCGDDPHGRILGNMSPALPGQDQQGSFVWDKDETPREDRKTLTMVPSPIMDREVEGDREYLCPEALGEANLIGKAADIFSLGILLLEAALNIVLPSNGDAWVQLRNDNFSDLKGNFVPRSEHLSLTRTSSLLDSSIPVLSDDILQIIKSMMKSNPDERWSVEDVWHFPVVARIREETRAKALVEENEEWLRKILGESL
ncbi:uncharacterized protein L203_101323 [Cryptococcus depauperatus CBS 7841]|uniref:Uncharacterized protein n=1 Tax=Cryptococcus depauperatus CBS 7841 TaxID=1295531 RepID=A0A1E3IC89_9TREE|nr:WEE/WEE-UNCLASSIFIED protein kinase [Cryptococcus depauperatus CBS 7841]